MGPVAGGGGGIHVFVAKGISLSAALDLDYHAPFARVSGESAGTTVSTEWEKTADIIDLGVNAGLSIWFR
jgi:hypothetical protein